jgi:hypothetical protein
MCITDPRRSRRSIYLRLSVWLSRAMWDAYFFGKEEVDAYIVLEQVKRLTGELHYIQHLRRGQRGPCELCSRFTVERFKKG